MKRKMILMLTVVAMLMGTPTAEAANTIGVERLSGNNRIETAIAISDKIYDKSDVVILASTQVVMLSDGDFQETFYTIILLKYFIRAMELFVKGGFSLY